MPWIPVKVFVTVHHRSHSRGLTLVELLVSMAIVLVIAGTVAPMVVAAVKRDKEQELRIALRQIRQALDDYKLASDIGRIARPAGSSGYPPNLSVLVLGVPDQFDPARRPIFFLRRLPRDPLAAVDGISAEQTWGSRSYGSDPAQPEAGKDVFDVFSRSSAVGLNGVPYRQW